MQADSSFVVLTCMLGSIAFKAPRLLKLKLQYCVLLIPVLFHIQCCALANTMKMHSTDGTLRVLSLVMQKDSNSNEVFILFPNCSLLFAPLFSHFLLFLSDLTAVTITERTQVTGIKHFFPMCCVDLT